MDLEPESISGVSRIKAVEHGFGVLIYWFEELLVMLWRDAALPPPRLRLRKYISTSLLIIDEVGFGPILHQEASQLFRLVSHHHTRPAAAQQPCAQHQGKKLSSEGSRAGRNQLECVRDGVARERR